MSTLKVNAIRHTGASSDAIELATDGSCTVKATNKKSYNLIINGSCTVAQRGTTSTSSGFQTVDRFQMSTGGTNATMTQSWHHLTSSDTGPWEKGLKHSFHILNAGQSGPDAADNCEIPYCIEAQDMASCGWDYTSASSYITLSFWIKSSVAQNFYGYLYTRDGTMKTYAFETGSLSADTWTKVTKTIPGHADISFDTIGTGQGMYVDIVPYYGTNYTDSGVSLNSWKTKDSSQLPVNTTTWWTTSNSTLEITGLQLEVGDFASDYCHEPYSETLRKCQRYYQEIHGGYGGGASSSEIVYCTTYPVKMRATPSVSQTAAMTFEEPSDQDRNQSSTGVSIRSSRCTDTGCVVVLDNYSGIIKDQLYFSSCNQNSGGKVTYSAEL